VDELDEEDFAGARLWPPRDLGLGNMGDGRIFDLLQQEHDLLNRLLMNEGLPPQRIGAGNWGVAPPIYRRPAGGAGVEADSQFENG
jgi:hypothetical protein